jgi:hypothetical protein
MGRIGLNDRARKLCLLEYKLLGIDTELIKKEAHLKNLSDDLSEKEADLKKREALINSYKGEYSSTKG